MPYTGKVLLRTRAAGDSSTALPFPLSPDPPQMLGHPACPPCASPKPFQLEGPQFCQPQREATHFCLSPPRRDRQGIKALKEGRIRP